MSDVEQSDDTKAAAIGAALAHVLSRPDSIRQRAQNAATISSAVAAALVVAAVTLVTRSDKAYKPWTLGFAFAALAFWVISVGLFVYAVTFVRHDEEPRNFQELVTSYGTYADKVRARTRAAALVSGIAFGAHGCRGVG